MKLEDFVMRIEVQLENFKRSWIEEHDKNPDEWPLEMEEADWEEQFNIFNY